LLVIDGIGLGLIAICTILEGIDLWNDFFHLYQDSNTQSLLFWLLGRTSQIVGLCFLITFALNYQQNIDLERFGMILLTVGPVLNLTASFLFFREEDPYNYYNKKWTSTELIELFGICILDVSMLHMKEHFVLLAEVSGFAVLMVAAAFEWDFENLKNENLSTGAGTMLLSSSSSTDATVFQSIFSLFSTPSSSSETSLVMQGVNGFIRSIAPSSWKKVPTVTFRADFIHMYDCLGLLLLTIVAIGQYWMKVQEEQQQQHHHHHHHQHRDKLHIGEIEVHHNNNTSKQNPSVDMNNISKLRNCQHNHSYNNCNNNTNSGKSNNNITNNGNGLVMQNVAIMV